MTINRLSAHSVKVQLSAAELKVFLPELPGQTAPDSPYMTRLVSFMLTKAEAVSGIAFSSQPVTVELLSAPDGGMAAYFTVQALPDTASGNGQAKTIRLAARFADAETLKDCCRQLEQEHSAILASMLYYYKEQYIISMKLMREQASRVHHLLLEYGRPFRLSAMNRARLTEFGECLCERDAVQYSLQSL